MLQCKMNSKDFITHTSSFIYQHINTYMEDQKDQNKKAECHLM